MSFDQIAEKLSPSKPKMTTNAIRTPGFVEKPHNSRHAAAEPRQVRVMTARKGQ